VGDLAAKEISREKKIVSESQFIREIDIGFELNLDFQPLCKGAGNPALISDVVVIRRNDDRWRNFCDFVIFAGSPRACGEEQQACERSKDCQTNLSYLHDFHILKCFLPLL
jgi:hypothetical protein